MADRHPGQFLFFALCFLVNIAWAAGQSPADALEKLKAHPDLIVFNGRIVSLDENMTRVQAMAVRQGRILALGGDAEIKALAGPKTQWLDVKGRMVLPGLIDAHSHPHAWAIPHWLSSDFAAKRYHKPDLRITYVNGDTLHEIVQNVERAVKQRAKELGPGKWIWITLFAKDNIREARHLIAPIFARRLIITPMLDQWAPENPVMVHGPGLVSPSVNSTKAKEIMRRVLGAERDGLRAIYSVPYEIILEGKSEPIGDLLKHEMLTCFAPYGITSFSSPLDTGAVLRALNRLDQRGELPLRWAWVHDIGFHSENPADFYRWLGDFRGQGSDHFWNNGVGKEAWEEAPWACTKAAPLPTAGKAALPADRATTPCPDQINYEDSVQYQIMKSALESGLRTTFLHAYTDGTYDAVFNLVEAALASGKLTLDQVRQLRIGLEHNMIVRPDQYEKLARFGIHLSFQGYQLHEDIKGPAFLRQFGEQYMKWMMPVKSLARAGVSYSINTDAHLTPIPALEAQPMDWPKDWEGSIWKYYEFFITRRMSGGTTFLAEEGIDRVEVIKAATLGGARRMLREKDLGSLEEGKLADFIVIDKDYFTIPADQIHTIKNLMTVVGGKTVYQSEQF